MLYNSSWLLLDVAVYINFPIKITIYAHISRYTKEITPTTKNITIELTNVNDLY